MISIDMVKSRYPSDNISYTNTVGGKTNDVRVQKLKYFVHSYGIISENTNLWKNKRGGYHFFQTTVKQTPILSANRKNLRCQNASSNSTNLSKTKPRICWCPYLCANNNTILDPDCTMPFRIASTALYFPARFCFEARRRVLAQNLLKIPKFSPKSSKKYSKITSDAPLLFDLKKKENRRVTFFLKKLKRYHASEHLISVKLFMAWCLQDNTYTFFF